MANLSWLPAHRKYLNPAFGCRFGLHWQLKNRHREIATKTLTLAMRFCFYDSRLPQGFSVHSPLPSGTYRTGDHIGVPGASMKSLVVIFFLLGCFASASTSNGIITISSPAHGSSVATPVSVTASTVSPPTCPAGIASLRVYPTSGNLLFKVSASSFTQSFILNPGSYPSFTVQEFDKCGGSSKVSINIKVTGSLPVPPAVPTWGYSNRRNNANTAEYILTPS